MELELWDEMRSVERRVDDLFRAFLGSRARTLFPALPFAWRGPFIPAADVFTRKDELVVRLELPGIDPARDVAIAVEDGQLVVSGERKQTEKIEEGGYQRMETCYGSFERRVPVPEGIDEKKVRAEYRDGILEIVILVPKLMEKQKPRRLPIKVAA